MHRSTRYYARLATDLGHALMKSSLRLHDKQQDSTLNSIGGLLLRLAYLHADFASHSNWSRL